mmetsp:Transcript_41167/g.47399  ORF Transcript_41167/g.47399 Transcript_41167/m.47399 type:complete len:151 (+) Transcript_41167:232-684(+)
MNCFIPAVAPSAKILKPVPIRQNAVRSECALVTPKIREEDCREPGALKGCQSAGKKTEAEYISISDSSSDEREDQLPVTQKDPRLTTMETGSPNNNLGETQMSENDDFTRAVFEIVKVNKTTKKEVRLTKSRRIISRCEHTFEKYYARGM